MIEDEGVPSSPVGSPITPSTPSAGRATGATNAQDLIRLQQSFYLQQQKLTEEDDEGEGDDGGGKGGDDGASRSSKNANDDNSSAAMSLDSQGQPKRRAHGILNRRASAWDRASARKKAAKYIQAFERVYTPARLVLTIIQARRLHFTLFGHKPDPFVIVRLDGIEVARTKILRSTGSPQWNHEVSLELPVDRDWTDCIIELKLYDADDGVGELATDDAALADEASVSSYAQEAPAPSSAQGESSSSSRRRSSRKPTLLESLTGTAPREGVAQYLGKVKFSGQDRLQWLGSMCAAGKDAHSGWLRCKRKGGSRAELMVRGQYVEGSFVDVPRKSDPGDDSASYQTLLTDTFLSAEPEEEDDDDDDDDDSSSSATHSDGSGAPKKEKKKRKKKKKKQKNDDDDEEEEEEEEDEDDTIEITVLAAKNLSRADIVGLSDPYAVVYFNDKEIGRTPVVDNNLFPRWTDSTFTVTVPAGAGITYEGKDYKLFVEVFDQNSSREDVFLGCATVELEDLEYVLGLKQSAQGKAVINSKDRPAPFYSFAYPDQVERGEATWFALVKNQSRSVKENKLVKGGVQIVGAYISGRLRPPPAGLPTFYKVSIFVESALGLSKVATGKKLLSMLGATSSSSGGNNINNSSSGSSKVASGKSAKAEETPECNSFAVVRWNGVVVHTTHTVRASYAPSYHTHVLVASPLVWDIKQCTLEIEIYAEDTSVAGRLSGAYGPFLGSAVVQGLDLVELLKGKINDDGSHHTMTFPLRISEHVPREDQTLVRGNVRLRGCLEPDFSKHGGRAIVSTVEESLGEAVCSEPTRPFLEVTVAECASLAQTDRFGTCNAFVSVLWNGRVRGTTAVEKNTLNPMWVQEVFRFPLPLNVRLVDCVLEFRVQDKSRIGTLSFLGEKRETNESLELLVHKRGAMVWLDLERSRYLSDKQNALVQGSVRVRVQYFSGGRAADAEDDEILWGGKERPIDDPPDLDRKTAQPARIVVSALGISEIAPLSGMKALQMVTAKSMPFLQVLWNGHEVGCTTPLSVSALALDGPDAASRVHEWSEETLSMIVPEDRPLEECQLEVAAWDSGLRTDDDKDTFLGTRVLTGLELIKAVFKTLEYQPVVAGELDEEAQAVAAKQAKEPLWLALGRTWDLPLEQQQAVRARVKLLVAYEPPSGPKLSRSEQEEIERLEAEAVERARQADEAERRRAAREAKRAAAAEAEAQSQSQSDPLGGSGQVGSVIVSGAVDDDLSTIATATTESTLLSPEELEARAKAKKDAYWAKLKEENRIDIPPGSTHYFTKHFEEATGKFYYYDHVTQATTYDRPPGDIRLYKSEAQLDDLRAKQEAAERERELEVGKRRVIMDKIVEEKRVAQTHYLNQKREAETRRQNQIWNRVCEDGAANKGQVNIAWQNFGYVHPMVYSFPLTYRMPLVALRLVGHGLKSLPDDFGQRLTGLEILSLSNNDLTELPESVILMTNLRELNVLKNRLTSLPAKIGLMCSLQRLEVANNLLELMPISLGGLNMMERVDFECNQLRLLPENLDNMTSCRFLNVNHNRLTRLPRCLARMPSLTSLSATHNLISYIPADLTQNINIKIFRLSCNKITVVPEKIGELKRLREFSVDWNDIKLLPLTFYQLRRLKTCRIDGNMNLQDPPPDVCVKGAKGIVEYYRVRFQEDIMFRMRKIVAAVQSTLHQVAERGLADPSLFEPEARVEGFEDPWFALQMPYFWGFLLPTMQKIWLVQGSENKLGETNTFTYDEKEVLWAFQNFIDAYGVVFKRQKAMFRRCSCKDANGNRKPCVPPQVGYQCYRMCTLFKTRVVMGETKKERVWQEQKRTGVAEAAKKAEKEALQYLNSGEGKLWLETEAYKRAEVALEALGGQTADKWRKKAADKHKSIVIAYYERKKAKVLAIRDKKAAEWSEELERAKNDLKGAREGYMKNTLLEQVSTLTKAIAEMPENEVMRRLTRECERKCADIDDEWADADSTDSSNSSAELPSSDDESPAAERRRERYIRRYHENEQATRRKKFRGNREVDNYPIPQEPFEVVLSAVQSVVDIVLPKNEKKERRRFKTLRRYKKWMRNTLDIVDLRIRKMFQTLGGTFDEIQKECKHELFRQYLQSNVDDAKQKAIKEYSVIDEVRQSMGGVGVEKIFKAWKRWALNKAQRLRRDARAEFKTSTKVFLAAMESVRIAQGLVDLWHKNVDVYTDQPFWVHELTGQITTDRPGLQHFLPPTFKMPPPPKDLPPGVSYDTSSDESENAFRSVKKKKAEDISSDSELSDEDEDEDEEEDDEDEDEDDEDDSEDDDSDGDEEEKGTVADDLSAITGATGLGSPASLRDKQTATSSSVRLPSIVPSSNVPSQALAEGSGSGSFDPFLDKRRRVSDVLSPRDWPPLLSKGGAAASVVVAAAAKTADGGDAGTVATAKSAGTVSTYSYGPDSLRSGLPGRLGQPRFQDEAAGESPLTELEQRVEEARAYLRRKARQGPGPEMTSKKNKGKNVALPAIVGVVDPTPLDVAAAESRDNAFSETTKADVRLRRKRNANLVSAERHETYMGQLHRVPRSLEQNIALAKSKNKVRDIYKKPEIAALFDLAGADHEAMAHLSGPEATKLRTVVAYRAMHVKKKLHDRAVKARLTKPKKLDIIGKYIAPIWRENHVGSSDEEEDDEEAQQAKEQRKAERKAMRHAKAKEVIDERELAKKMRSEADAQDRAKAAYRAPKDLRIGKPRESSNF